jgi:hypothetical protein
VRIFIIAALAIVLPGVGRAQTRPQASSNTYNPEVSVDALFLYQNSNRGNDPLAEPQNGIGVQETEMQFAADVDPYSRFIATFSIAPKVNTTTIPHTSSYEISPEELFVDSLQLPGVNLRVGKFKAAFGRHNQLHTHAFPFIDAPLTNAQLLGDEGINDVGISAAYLVPGISWFSEVTGQVLSGRTEGSDYFNSRSPNDSVFVLHAKNLVDLSEDTTAELGLSIADGKNSSQDANAVFQKGSTDIYGADFTIKWRPVIGGKTHAIIWANEYMDRRIQRSQSRNDSLGYASWVQLQFAERWWAGARSEYMQARDTDAVSPLNIQPYQRRYSALLAFLPSEFSGLRLQYSQLYDGRDSAEQKLLLQLNVLIGSHPAHAY